MIRKVIKLSILVFLFIGCSAKMEHLPGAKLNSKYAPINAEEQYGLISYLNAGAASVREARREDAYKQMFEACNGKYNIISESNKSDGAVFIPNGSGGGFISNTNNIYIKFNCVK